MTLFRPIPWLALLTVCFALSSQAAPSKPLVYAASDGAGTVRLLWYVPVDRWPAGGFRIEDGNGKTLIRQVLPGETSLLQPLEEEDRKRLSRLHENLPKIPRKEQEVVSVVLGTRAFSDWDYAKAAGMARELRDLSKGKRRLRIVGLDKSGRATSLALSSPSIDPAVATPLPRAPKALSAQAQGNEVALYWQPASAKPSIPVLAYRVERSNDAALSETLTPRPVLTGDRWENDRAAYRDGAPPLEQRVSYSVAAIDALGRRGEIASTGLFVGDSAALKPPQDLHAERDGGLIRITWQPVDNPHATGILVERAFSYSGPYETLTPDALDADAKAYGDQAVSAGTNYYYRLRAMDPRGKLGAPSPPVAIQAWADEPPEPPRDLRAENGATRIRLTWQPVDAAGYIVERRADSESRWSRLNDFLVIEPRYDDHLGQGNGGDYAYRVLAVSQDNQTGEPSRVIELTRIDITPPGAPRIVSASSDNGRVKLRFTPALPEVESRQFLLLRGGADDPGLVLGDPIDGDSREITDNWVEGGNTYWYRMVAMDAAGNRSKTGEPVRITVTTAGIPKPARPDASFKAKPFRQVQLTFKQPPTDLQVILQRAMDATHWQHIAGPMSGSMASDTSPPASNKTHYRLIYQAANGALGPASDPIEVALP